MENSYASMPLTVVATCGCTGRAEGRLTLWCVTPGRQCRVLLLFMPVR